MLLFWQFTILTLLKKQFGEDWEQNTELQWYKEVLHGVQGRTTNGSDANEDDDPVRLGIVGKWTSKKEFRDKK